MILQKGFTIQSAVSSSDTTPENNADSARLVMRSMMGVLTAAARNRMDTTDLLKTIRLSTGVEFGKLVPPLVQQERSFFA